MSCDPMYLYPKVLPSGEPDKATRPQHRSPCPVFPIMPVRSLEKKGGQREGEGISPSAPVSPPTEHIQGRPEEDASHRQLITEAYNMACVGSISGFQIRKSFWDIPLVRGSDGGRFCQPEVEYRHTVWARGGAFSSAFTPSCRPGLTLRNL